MFRLSTKFRPETEAFERARAAGFRGAELWLSSEVLEDSHNVLSAARMFPLYYAVHFPNEADVNEASVRQAAQLYQDLECSVLVIHEAQFECHGRQLVELVRGIRLGVENHKLDRTAFMRWAETYPGLTLDVEHLWKYTLNQSSLRELVVFLRSFLKQFGDRVCHVHLTGYRPGGIEHAPLHANPEMTREILNTLADYHYSGLVVSEADPPFQRDEDLKRDVALYREWFDCHSVPCTPALLTAMPTGDAAGRRDAAGEIQPASALPKIAAPLRESRRRNEASPLTDQPG